MQGHLARGDLWIGMVKVLHDNWTAEGVPAGAYGMGHTELAWSRDGVNWVRDTTPFFEPDPTVGAWDHAHAWIDYQTIVGDEVYLYYGGYEQGHKRTATRNGNSASCGWTSTATSRATPPPPAAPLAPRRC